VKTSICNIGCFCKGFFRAFNERHQDVLLGRSSEVITARFNGRLLSKKWRMAWVSDDLGDLRPGRDEPCIGSGCI
jgi:hypothetical protein